MAIILRKPSKPVGSPPSQPAHTNAALFPQPQPELKPDAIDCITTGAILPKLPPLEGDKRGKLTFLKQFKPRDTAKRLKEKKAAAWLEVSVFTLRRIRKRNEIGFSKIGGTYCYSIKDLEAYVEQVSQKPCQQKDSKSESTTSASTQPHQSGKQPGSIKQLDKHAAHLWAQKTFTKQN